MYVCFPRIGGLGNQLFRYAAARAVAETYGYLLLVETEGKNAHNYLGHNYATLFMKDAEEVRSLSDRTTTFETFEQPGGAFGPWSVQDVPKNPTTGICLQGYFQYLPPLLPVLPGIRNMLWVSLSEQRKLMATRYSLSENGDDNAVFMHVRRGDYTALPHIHFLQDPVYYQKAISFIKQQTTVSKIHVISDDMEWCKTQPWNFHVDIVFLDEPDELCCFALMALCRGGAVIANSTFSWWGALVGNSRHVCYPSRWVRDTVHDLFPKHWTRIG
jgi:hypothetical protein